MRIEIPVKTPGGIENSFTIVGNGHDIEILHGFEIDVATLEKMEGKALDAEELEFLQSFTYIPYKGYLHRLEDFTIDVPEFVKSQFDAICPESYFSGLLLKVSNTENCVKMYRYWE